MYVHPGMDSYDIETHDGAVQIDVDDLGNVCVVVTDNESDGYYACQVLTHEQAKMLHDALGELISR